MTSRSIDAGCTPNSVTGGIATPSTTTPSRVTISSALNTLVSDAEARSRFAPRWVTSSATMNAVWAAMPPIELLIATLGSFDAAATTLTVRPASDVADPSRTAPEMASPSPVRSASRSTTPARRVPGERDDHRRHRERGDGDRAGTRFRSRDGFPGRRWAGQPTEEVHPPPRPFDPSIAQSARPLDHVTIGRIAIAGAGGAILRAAGSWQGPWPLGRR
jgi:hypothetical protein